jgi:hypothetical protein
MNPLVKDYLLKKMNRPAEDPGYMAAQSAMKEQQSGNKFAQLAAGIGDALARKDSTSTDRFFAGRDAAIADQTVGEFNRQKAMAMADKQYQRDEEAYDPNSTASQSFRRIVEGTLPKIVQAYGKDWNKVSAADKENILNYGRMQSDNELKNARLDIARQNQQAKQMQEKDIKTAQASAIGFGKRVEQSEEVFDKLVNDGYDRSSIMAGIGSSLFNPLKSSEAQQQAQAERNFVNAVLRRESGSAIAPSEFASAEAQYFPRAGDGEEVIAQKKANRQQVLASLKAEAGEKNWNKVERVPTATEDNTLKKQKSSTPNDGRITVTNGKETFKVLPEDLQDALKDGFQEVVNE